MVATFAIVAAVGPSPRTVTATALRDRLSIDNHTW
jgi:hypothetical protein